MSSEISYVSRDTCEERKDRFEQMFDTIIERLERIEEKQDKNSNSNGKIALKITGIMFGFCSLTVGLVAIIVNYAK